MRCSFLKSVLVIVLCFCFGMTSISVQAAPTTDQNYVEITLSEFLERYPNYRGIDDPRDAPISRAVSDPGYVAHSYDAPFEWRKENNKWYLYADGGETKVTTGGWYLEGTTWYFLYPVGVTTYTGVTSTGEMAIGWESIGGHWYYFSSSGAMQTDWYQISNVWYYMRTAQETLNGISYPRGSMVTGEHFLNSVKGSATKDKNFYFDINGALQLWYYPLNASPAADKYFVTSPFAQSRIINGTTNIHNGLDLRAAVGVNIDSPCVGTVAVAAEKGSMGNVIIVRSNVVAPNGNNIIVRIMHMSEFAREFAEGDSIVRGTYLGKTGNTGGVAAHFHIDMNAFNITTSAVTSTNGQNPAAFFTDVTWNTTNWNPYGSDRVGYQD